MHTLTGVFPRKGKSMDTAREKPTPRQRHRLKQLLLSSVFTAEEAHRIAIWLNSPRATKEKASEMIDNALARIKKRYDAKKASAERRAEYRANKENGGGEYPPKRYSNEHPPNGGDSANGETPEDTPAPPSVPAPARKAEVEKPPGQLADRTLKGNDLTKDQQLTLQAVIEFSRRVLNQGMGTEPSITSPLDVIPELRHIKDLKREHFVCVYLNARNQILNVATISIGSLNASLVHPREVLGPAIESSVASMILAHNHPSTDVIPSREDIELTRRLVKAGEIMGIEILDHLVIGGDRFLSMKEANVF